MNYLRKKGRERERKKREWNGEATIGQEGEKKPDQTAEAAAKGEDNGMGIVEMEEEDPLVAVCMVSKWKGGT